MPHCSLLGCCRPVLCNSVITACSLSLSLTALLGRYDLCDLLTRQYHVRTKEIINTKCMIHQKITCSGAIHKLIKVSYVYLLDLVCILYKRMRLYTSFVLTPNLWRVSNTNKVNHVIRKIYFLFEGVFCLSALYKITRKTMNS